MPKLIKQGVQTRQINCGCGFIISGQIRDANMQFKLHKKKCPFKESGNLNIIPVKLNSHLQKIIIDEYLINSLNNLNLNINNKLN